VCWDGECIDLDRPMFGILGMGTVSGSFKNKDAQYFRSKVSHPN
jgi:hypothetical protein